MTREEAIWILNETQVVYFAPNGKKKVQEALEMAIEALSAEYEDYEHATLVDIKEPLKVLVVRCKDCKWWGGNKSTEHNNHLCKRAIDQDVEYWTKANDFCSYGERREP